MVRICYVVGTLEVGGAERQLYLLMKNIDRERFCPVLVALRDGRMRGDFEKVARVRVAGKRWKLDVFFFARLLGIIKREKPDILHTFMFTSNFWGRLAGLAARVPFIVASERSMDFWKGPLHLWIDRFFARFTRKIVCNSNEVKARYEKVLGRYSGRLSVIYNGIDTGFYDGVKYREELRKELGITEGKTILTGGRLCPEKGLDDFMEAVSIVVNRVKAFRNARFLIAGEGSEKKSLMELRERLGLKDYIIFTGYRKDLPEIIKMSDIVVLSSLWEGMPNLIIEAMALRKPVISTDVGGSREIIKNGETGFLVPVKNPEMLAGAMLALLQDESLGESMGAKGCEFVKRELELSVMVNKYEGLYRELAGK